MRSAIVVRSCGLIGILGCSWFWVFWFVGPHLPEYALIQLTPAMTADIISIPLLLIAGRFWKRWFYVLAIVALATWLVVGFRLH
jgi:hypothetical protein